MRLLLAIVLLVAFLTPVAYGQMSGTRENSSSADQEGATFPKIAFTSDKQYEVDLTWEPHKILTNQKTIFIFQFYDYKSGGLVPMVDYQFVISQNGKELARIPGTTTQAGDYKYFAFDKTGPVTISLDKIQDTDLSVSYNTVVYQNPNSTAGHVTIVQPARNISNQQRSIFPIIEDVIVGALIALLVWLARDSILRRLKIAE